MDALPRDVFLLASRFLTGFELLALSHVNRRMFRDLLAPNGVAWRSRMLSKTFSCSDVWRAKRDAIDDGKPRWKTKYKRLLGDLKHAVKTKRTPSMEQRRNRRTYKELYFTSLSLRFYESPDGVRKDRRMGSAVKLGDAVRIAWNEDAFSFDLWFAMLPPNSSDTVTHTGECSVIMGAQSSEWPRLDLEGGSCQAFVSVDRQGNLYCSMTVNNPVVASQLKYERWYHVALSFCRSAGDWRRAKQCVYLDGELVHASEGSIHPKWRFLDFAQLGSGCVSSTVMGGEDETRPAVVTTRWCGFDGAVDECRLWSAALTESQVRLLQQGDEDQVTDSGVACAWSLKQDSDAVFYGTSYEFVHSTRPRERRYIES